MDLAVEAVDSAGHRNHTLDGVKAVVMDVAMGD